ncbi:hypothetical protein CRE_06258 [Caenorhabditis remanei]|uniref:Uncharacterized protein n=1 Tax=Caenorhabditis remanei TaxID=31234 RepID=E3NUV3_CAERE|nr:hypothetical protein CRE_06258 [Caenorhabditis remanei]
MDHKMLIRVFTHFPVVINWIAFFLALLMNYFLTYCIRSSETKHFGNYEKMMYANMANLLFFSTLHTYLHPIISIERNVLYVFTRLDYFQLPKLSIRILMALYGMSYCMSLVLCAVTFIYRFDRVCHSTLQYFQTRKQMLLWLFVVFFLGLYWGFCIFHFAQATSYVDKIIEKPLEEDFGVAFVNTTYVAAVYEIQNLETGLTEWNQSGLVMGISFGTIIVGSMVTIFFCVGRVWMKVNTFVHSQIFDKVQKELFKAQCLQALIPVAVIFIPILSFLALPMLNIHGYTGLSFVSVFIGLYPVIDPIALMYTITEYRELMFELFTCR